MQRFISGRPVNLTHEFTDDASETALIPGTVTVTVTPIGGTTPVSTGSPTLAGSVYTRSVGMLATGVYTVVWTGVTSAVTVAVDTEYVEVAGGRLFTVKEARASDDDLTASRYPPADVMYYRTVVEDEFERITGRSFIPVTRRFRQDLDGSGMHLLPVRDVSTLVSIEIEGAALDLSGVDVDTDGIISGLPATAQGPVWVTVTYGFTSVPADVKRVGMIRTRYFLASERSGIPDRATTYQPADGGTYSLATPGVRGSHTGMPEVDEALDGYTYDMLNSILGGIG